MNKKIIYILAALSILITVAVVLVVIKISSIEKMTPQEVIVHLQKDHREFIPQVPSKMDFCGEEVPLNDFDVYERMERELLVNVHWSSATILYLKRANRWFPIIEPILKRNGIPNDFKYLAIIESGLTNAVSPAGAAGFWQFMAPVAKQYGLEVYDKIDERYNLEKATQATCRYLKEAFAKYGSWTMAAASYNFGMNGIDKQIGRQRSRNYYNLYLVEETSRFVFRLLAIKEIFSDPYKYGFNIDETELYKAIETKEIIIKKEIKDLALFAKENGINYKIIKIFNPWIKDNFLPNPNKKAYSIKIPIDGEIEILSE
jgi:hypothetical protein